MKTLFRQIEQFKNSNLSAIWFNDKDYSYDYLIRYTKKLAEYLKNGGIKKGDVITVVLPNIPLTIYSLYALDLLGCVQNIIHPLTPFDRIMKTMNEVGSKHVILLGTLYQDNIDKLDPSINYYFVNPLYDMGLIKRNLFYLKFKKAKEKDNIHLIDKFRSFKEIDEVIDRDPLETSIYLHSGGTTGVSKTIELSDNSLNNLADKVPWIVTGDLRGKGMLAVLPTFHGFGLGMGVHAALSNGGESYLMMKFNSDKTLELIDKNRVHFVIGIPLLYEKLYVNPKFKETNFKNVIAMFIGGDKVPPSLIEKYNKHFEENGSKGKLLEGYGLTETVTVCSVNTPEDFKVSSIGRPLHGIEMEIRDEGGKKLGPNEDGEIYIKGDTTMNGYLNDIDTTNKSLILENGEIWFKSGDIGYIDEDGFIFFKGRAKRVFKIAGINVYPHEVERLITNLDEVFDASLEYFSEPKPHLNLYIIKHKDYSDIEVIRKKIVDELEHNVLKYSMPQKIIFLDKFPETNVGKIDHSKFIDE